MMQYWACEMAVPQDGRQFGGKTNRRDLSQIQYLLLKLGLSAPGSQLDCRVQLHLIMSASYIDLPQGLPQ